MDLHIACRNRKTAIHLKTHCPSRLQMYSLDLCLRSVLACPRVFSPQRRLRMFLGSVFARPCAFATTRIFAPLVFRKRLRMLMCLHNATCLRPTCLREMSPHAHVSSRQRVSSPDLSSRSVFARRVFPTTRALARPVFARCLLTCMASLREVSWQGHCAQEASAYAHVFADRSSQPVLGSMCLQNASSIFGRYVHPQATAMEKQIHLCGSSQKSNNGLLSSALFSNAAAPQMNRPPPMSS